MIGFGIAVDVTICCFNRDQVLFIYINLDEEDNLRILEFFGLKVTDCPTYRYIQLGEDMMKYKPDTSDVTVDAVRAFVESIVDGTRQVREIRIRLKMWCCSRMKQRISVDICYW